jgi:hypothetical protein
MVAGGCGHSATAIVPGHPPPLMSTMGHVDRVTPEMCMAEKDIEDDILTRTIGDASGALTGLRGVKDGARWAARRLKIVAHEEMLILDLPLSAVAESVKAALPVMKHPLLPDQPVAVNEQHAVSWIAGGGIGRLNPVLITVSLASEPYGTTLKVRGVAKEGIIQQRSAQKLVDRLTGLICDLFDIYDVIG